MNQRAHAAANDMERLQLPDWKLSYRIPEAAAATGFGESTLWKRISQGRLLAKRDGTATIVTRNALQSFLDNLPDVTPSKRRA